MKITKKSLLYDIGNLAYAIADTGQYDRHTLHRVRDICEDGNIDRVSRVLGLAYSNLLTVLMPILSAPAIHLNRDFSVSPRDYEFCFRSDNGVNAALTREVLLKIKESSREYMVCAVLADWLSITLPEAAEMWRLRLSAALESIKETVSETLSHTAGFTRRISPL